MGEGLDVVYGSKVSSDHATDRLERLFNLQKDFQYRLFQIDLPQVRKELITTTVTSIVAELGEILEEFQGWKHWRKDVPEYDERLLLLEVVDLWHFVINLTLFLGISEDELFTGFLEKNAINHQRQDQNY